MSSVLYLVKGVIMKKKLFHDKTGLVIMPPVENGVMLFSSTLFNVVSLALGFVKLVNCSEILLPRRQ